MTEEFKRFVQMQYFLVFFIFLNLYIADLVVQFGFEHYFFAHHNMG